MQLISWLMLGRSISQANSRQMLWVQRAMNQELPLCRSTFFCLLSLTVPSLSTSQHMLEDVTVVSDNTRSSRLQQLLLFNATLNPHSTSDYFFFLCLSAGLSISCLWISDGVLMAKEHHSASEEWTFRSIGWLWRGKFLNVKQNHLQ